MGGNTQDYGPSHQDGPWAKLQGQEKAGDGGTHQVR